MATPEMAVAAAAIAELGVDFALYNFADDVAFQAYVVGISEVVISQIELLIGSTFNVSDPGQFESAYFEVSARLAQRLLNQYYMGILFTEQITIGPIKIESVKNSGIVPLITALIEQYHLRSNAALAGQAPGRKGAIRVWTPLQRNTYI